MLQFIYGLPRSGKTEWIFEKIKELSLQNQKSILIVPEQSSFETEKRALKTLGNNFFQNLKVLSFSRLFDEVCRNHGGLSAKMLSDTEKVIFMSKAPFSAMGHFCSSVPPRAIFAYSTVI